MASASFSVEAVAYTEAVAVVAGNVDLALISTSGVDTVSWEFVSNSDPDISSNPTITPAGSPLGATASFTMPSGARSYMVRCTVNEGIADREATAQGIIGVVDAGGRIPFCAGETTERHPTHGYTEALNDISEAMPSAGGDLTLAGDLTVGGQFQFGSATVDQLNKSYGARQVNVADSSTITLWSIDPTVLFGALATITVGADVQCYSLALGGFGFVTLRARFRISGGTVAQVGTTDTVDDEGESMSQATEFTGSLDVSSGAIRLRFANASGDVMDVVGATIAIGGMDL